eukprot:TRINITY_DN108756_c0_g1_i1.p1 TRINITY_DN108756_c0_g1~~TRINITY_DN108756_c0_g1_i1.p1  ORF type:complete len:210 (+),score=72.77 TRINITY_DN108756_c0_g1_i1:79-708(+)
MNFVRAETLVQEITADGKVRDIVTQIKRSEAEREADRKEDIIRNLPEFKRDRGEGLSAGEQRQAAEEQAADEEEKAKEEKAYRVRTIDEDEFEHYQHIEEAERERKRKQKSEDKEAAALFESERKRLKEDGAEEKVDLLSTMRQHNLEKAERKNKAAPSAADRLKGRVTVKARSTASAEQTPAKQVLADQGPAAGGALLAGYGSDSDDE